MTITEFREKIDRMKVEAREQYKKYGKVRDNLTVGYWLGRVDVLGHVKILAEQLNGEI